MHLKISAFKEDVPIRTKQAELAFKENRYEAMKGSVYARKKCQVRQFVVAFYIKKHIYIYIYCL